MIMNFISLRRISVTRVRGRMMEIVLVSLGENFKDTERKMSEGENEKRDLSNGEIFQRQFSNGEFFFQYNYSFNSWNVINLSNKII